MRFSAFCDISCVCVCVCVCVFVLQSETETIICGWNICICCNLVGMKKMVRSHCTLEQTTRQISQPPDLHRKQSKVKGILQQPEVAQGVPGRLRSRIFLTFRQDKGGRSSAKRTGRLYPRRNPRYSLSEAESTSEHMITQEMVHMKVKVKITL